MTDEWCNAVIETENIVQGGKKSLSVAIIDEFYTFELIKKTFRKIDLDLEFRGQRR